MTRPSVLSITPKGFSWRAFRTEWIGTGQGHLFAHGSERAVCGAGAHPGDSERSVRTFCNHCRAYVEAEHRAARSAAHA